MLCIFIFLSYFTWYSSSGISLKTSRETCTPGKDTTTPCTASKSSKSTGTMNGVFQSNVFFSPLCKPFLGGQTRWKRSSSSQAHCKWTVNSSYWLTIFWQPIAASVLLVVMRECWPKTIILWGKNYWKPYRATEPAIAVDHVSKIDKWKKKQKNMNKKTMRCTFGQRRLRIEF